MSKHGRILGPGDTDKLPPGAHPDPEIQTEGECCWCRAYVTDGRKAAGSESRALMIDGDFGCNESPDTCDEGVGGHALASDPFFRRATRFASFMYGYMLNELECTDRGSEAFVRVPVAEVRKLLDRDA